MKGYEVFNANCKSCHRLRNNLVGPELANIFNRRDSPWVRKMIQNSQKMIRSGDPQAVEIYKEYNQAMMTSFQSMPKEDLDALLAFLQVDTWQNKEMSRK